MLTFSISESRGPAGSESRWVCGVPGQSHGAGPGQPGDSALLWLQTRHPPVAGGGDHGGGGAPGVLGASAVRQQLRALVRQPGPGGNRLRYNKFKLFMSYNLSKV